MPIQIGNYPNVEAVAACFPDRPSRQVVLVWNCQDYFIHKFTARDPGKIGHAAEHIAHHQLAVIQETNNRARIDVLALQDRRPARVPAARLRLSERSADNLAPDALP